MTNPEGIVSPEVAAELKRLGFGVPCLYRYKNTREGAKYGKGRHGEVRNWNNGNHTSAPTRTVAMEWLIDYYMGLKAKSDKATALYRQIEW